MANPEHLEILNKGVDYWNDWRISDRSLIDLSRVKLYNIKLSGINLAKVDLSYSEFIESDFKRATFFAANLTQTKFINSDLTEADLSEANLCGSKYYSSNLSRANLFRSNLSEAVLKNADLNGAFIGFTIFAFVDLSTVKNLNSVIHRSSSSVDIETLYYSKGNIPAEFLRGCGVPDQMIEYAKSLTANPIEYYSCFISYSHHDEDIARRIHNDLQAAGVRCWFAPHDLKIGDKIRPVIDDTIRVHDKLLLILSEYSVQSDWVEHEVEHALSLETERKKGMLFPVRLDEAIMDSKTGWAGNVRRQRHIGNFTKWKDHDAYQALFKRLLRDLMTG